MTDCDVTAVAGYGVACSITAMAESVLAGAPRRFALAGHSMGGRVALEIMRLEPERVDRLALFDTGVHPRGAGEREKRMALLRLGRDKGMQALVDAWLPPMVHPSRRNDDAFMTPMRNMCVAAGIDRFAHQVQALLDRPDVQPVLSTIDCPVLVAAGRQDEWSPVSQHEQMAAAIAGSTLVVFEDAGHMTPAETPDQVSRALQAWLAA